MSPGIRFAAVVTLLAAVGCGSEPAEISVTFPGDGSGSEFRLVNATDRDWSDVTVTVRGLRPDGIETACAEERIGRWGAGDSQVLPRCGDDRTLVVIETGARRAFFVLAGDTLYRKLGRKEIPIS